MRGDKVARVNVRAAMFMVRATNRAILPVLWRTPDVTNLIQPFLLRPLRPLFCEATNVRPEDCFAGKVILADIPAQEHGIVGKLAALVFKRLLQLAIMRRHGPPAAPHRDASLRVGA